MVLSELLILLLCTHKHLSIADQSEEKLQAKTKYTVALQTKAGQNRCHT